MNKYTYLSVARLVFAVKSLRLHSDSTAGYQQVVAANRHYLALVFKAIDALELKPEQEAITTTECEDVLADHRRLVRELDVLLNGEEGAAKQASLCDIVAQVRSQKAQPVEATSEAIAIALMALDEDGWKPPMDKSFSKSMEKTLNLAINAQLKTGR